MNDQDTLALLIYCTELDGRHTPNEIKVKAWADVINAEAEDMPVGFAQKVVRNHYAKLDVMVSPAIIVKAWKQHKTIKLEQAMAVDREQMESHCGRSGCMCTHNLPCFKGWIDTDPERTSACKVCRPSLAAALSMAAPPGMRGDADYAMIRNRDKEW